MTAVFELRHLVQPDEMDDMGHVNNLVYLKWLQSAAWKHSVARGWGMPNYREIDAGWVVRRHEIEYLRPAFAGDEVLIRTWIADMKKSSSLRRYEILRPVDETRLVVASTNWAFISFSTQRLTRIPPAVIESFEVVPD